VQQCLALAATASQISRFAVFLQLRYVAPNGASTRDLSQIIFTATPGIVAAIPLKPAARVVWMNPALATPFRERLRGVHAKMIQRRARTLR
jgi:hypothetical protein